MKRWLVKLDTIGHTHTNKIYANSAQEAIDIEAERQPLADLDDEWTAREILGTE